MRMTANRSGGIKMTRLKTWLVCFAIGFILIHGYYFFAMLRAFKGDNYVFEGNLVGSLVSVLWDFPNSWLLIYLGMTLLVRIIWWLLMQVRLVVRGY
jgi:hypothetical protein